MRTLKKMLLDEAHYKLIAIDLLEQQAIDADLKAIQIIFTGNFDPAWNATFFIINEVIKTVLDFSQVTVTVLWFYFIINSFLINIKSI